jgi:hypothetical protein
MDESLLGSAACLSPKDLVRLSVCQNPEHEHEPHEEMNEVRLPSRSNGCEKTT